MKHLMHDFAFIIRNWRYLHAHNALRTELRNWWEDYDYEPYDDQAPTMNFNINNVGEMPERLQDQRNQAMRRLIGGGH